MRIQEFLAQNTSAKIVRVTTKTPVKLLVAGKHLGEIFKVSVKNGIVGADYSSATNNGIAAKENPTTQEEANAMPFFQAESLWHGKGRSVSKFICEHIETKKQYLKFLPKLNSEGFEKSESYYVDASGEKVSKEKFEQFLPKQNNAPNVGGVKWQVISLENILDIR